MKAIWHQGRFMGFALRDNSGGLTSPVPYKLARLVQLGYVSEPVFIDAPKDQPRHSGYGEL